jgi:hypothetical protein
MPTVGVSRASGVPDYGPGAGTSNFIPEIYSGKLIEKFYKTTVFGEIASTDYEGDIVGFGSNVIIRGIPDVTVSDYVIGQNLNYQRPERVSTNLPIDRAKFFAVVLNTVDVRQADIDLSDIFAEDGSIQLKIAADADMLSVIPSQIGTPNQGANAGNDVGNINLGTAASPVVMAKDEPTTAGTGVRGVVDFMTDWGQVLDEQNVPDEGRWCVVPPWFVKLIKQSPLKIASLSGDNISILRNGKVGEIDRFTIYQSRNVLRSGGSPAVGWAVVFGHSAGLAFAAQITEAEMLQNPNDFGYLVRGLLVYGYKVIEDNYLGLAYVSPG